MKLTTRAAVAARTPITAAAALGRRGCRWARPHASRNPGRFTRVISKFAVAGAVVATLAGVGFGAGPATADPLPTPSLTTLAGVGSNLLAPLFDSGTSSTSPGCLGGAAGSFVHDYNTSSPAPPYPIASWDAVNLCLGVANDTITTKAKSAADTSCELPRPDDSTAGVAALNNGQIDANKVDGQTVYCLDYARSDTPPMVPPAPGATYQDAFSALAQDGLTWAYPTCGNRATGCAGNGGPKANPQPASLTLAQLNAIYTCSPAWADWPGTTDPIGVVVPPMGSGTYTNWLNALSMIPPPKPLPCWQDTAGVNGNAVPIQENTGLSAGNIAQFTTTQTIGGVSIPPQDDIFFYSIGDWIAQDPAVNGVGGHATDIWGHGNLKLGKIVNGPKTPVPVTRNSAGQPRINPNWNPLFFYTLYGVTRNGCFSPTSTAVCLPSRTPPAGGTVYPTYETTGLKALFGTEAEKGWICSNATAKADIVSYGFTKLSSKTCGELTAGN